MCHQPHSPSQLDLLGFLVPFHFRPLQALPACLPLSPAAEAALLLCWWVLAGWPGQRQRWLSSVDLTSDLGRFCVLRLRGTAFLVTLSLPSGRFPAFSYIRKCSFSLLLCWRQKVLPTVPQSWSFCSLAVKGPDKPALLPRPAFPGITKPPPSLHLVFLLECLWSLEKSWE